MSQFGSVICLGYNHEEFAEESLQSVYDQTYQNLELVVLDDGSSDETSSVVRKKLESSPFSSVFIEQENSGNVARNLNKAIAHSSGDFLTFLSLDDRLMPDSIQSKVTLLLNDENMAFVADTGYQTIDTNGKLLGVERRPPRNISTKSIDDLLENELSLVGFFLQGQLFKRWVIDEIGGFDEDLNGDDIVLRVKLLRHIQENPHLRFRFLEGISFAHREHPNNLAGNTLRQIKTAVDIKESFFKNRSYPATFYVWLESYFRKCLQLDSGSDLQSALDYHPVIDAYFNKHKRTWKYRRRFAKSKIKQKLNLFRRL